MHNILAKRKCISILEVCGGSGIGGCALSTVLKEGGYKVSTLITDIRERDLKKAFKWIGENKDIQLKIRVLDALEIEKLGRKFDIILMYGHSTPHFDPWMMIRFLAKASKILTEDGVLIIDDADRRFNIFYLLKYRELLIGKTLDNKIYLDIHTGYNTMKGTFKRTYITLPGEARKVDMEFYYWGIAELSALIWVFFKDIDVIKHDRNYFILATKPRNKLSPEDFENNPMALQK